jgi:lysophospholipase L1-like esterase
MPDENYQLSFTAAEIDERLTRAGNSILFTEQALTEEQKAQARANIGIVLEDEEVVTRDVEYTFDGDIDSDKNTWVRVYDTKFFVKVADLPDGEINLVGGTVSVVVPTNAWSNFNYTITEEMLDETVNMYDSEIKAKVSGFTQIFYQRTGMGDKNPMTMVAICTKAGQYNVVFSDWAATATFSETGVYFMTDIPSGGQKYVGSLTCSVTSSSGESEETVENPAEYDGNEIQVFTRGLCVGDSITEGVFNHSGGQVSIKKYAYPSVLKRMTGIDIVNAGISGATSGTWYDASVNSTPHWGRWVNNEWVLSESPDAGESDTVSTALDYSGFDFAIIHLGINDIFMMGDATIDETVSNFETNINNIINKLKTANTGIKVFLCTIIPSYAVPGNANYTAINKKIREIANATEDVFLIDLNEYSECKEGTPYSYYHLTALGYHRMATEIKSLISYTIKKNLNEFNEVQFIGTDYYIGA